MFSELNLVIFHLTGGLNLWALTAGNLSLHCVCKCSVQGYSVQGTQLHSNYWGKKGTRTIYILDHYLYKGEPAANLV